MAAIPVFDEFGKYLGVVSFAGFQLSDIITGEEVQRCIERELDLRHEHVTALAFMKAKQHFTIPSLLSREHFIVKCRR